MKPDLSDGYHVTYINCHEGGLHGNLSLHNNFKQLLKFRNFWQLLNLSLSHPREQLVHDFVCVTKMVTIEIKTAHVQVAQGDGVV